MTFNFDFKFTNASTPFGDIGELEYRERWAPVTRKQGKPVRLFYTHGMQVVGVPEELIRILGPDAIRSITSAHFETEYAFYLLRIENLARMALPK